MLERRRWMVLIRSKVVLTFLVVGSEQDEPSVIEHSKWRLILVIRRGVACIEAGGPFRFEEPQRLVRKSRYSCDTRVSLEVARQYCLDSLHDERGSLWFVSVCRDSWYWKNDSEITHSTFNGKDFCVDCELKIDVR